MKDDLAKISRAIGGVGFLVAPGAHVVVDGQYGSTGKGLAVSMLAHIFGNNVRWVSSNAGPNSGHTSYVGDQKIVLKQLPTYPVIAAKLTGKGDVITRLNAGAVIDPYTLAEEIAHYAKPLDIPLSVHPHAAIIQGNEVADDVGTRERIGSTGKGVGPAIARKVMRHADAVVEAHTDTWNFPLAPYPVHNTPHPGLIEVSQGFSLGLNSGFYPYATSRECTVAQALSDAGIHPSFLRQTMMVVRTFPIRVAGESGPCYPDQIETSWELLGVEPERTTVTNKIRRVFTWSDIQFREALLANRPEHIFVNFMNYLDANDVEPFVRRVERLYLETLHKRPFSIILGYGPKVEDCILWQ